MTNNKSVYVQILKLIAVTLTFYFLISGYLKLTSRQTVNSPTTGEFVETTGTSQSVAIVDEPSATPTATLLPTATAIDTPTSEPVATNSPTASPTIQPSRTNTATASPTTSLTIDAESVVTDTATAAATTTSTNTATPKPTNTATASPTASASSTASATTEPTATATQTLTQTPASTPTDEPTVTPSLTVISTASLTVTASITPTATELAATDTPTPEVTSVSTTTTTITNTTTATNTVPPSPTPTITPTPVPRTIRANNVPDYTLAEPHFWFARAYDNEYFTWGSTYYPYGTNNNGDYLWHRGIDIQNPQNTPIIATADGEVFFADADTARVVGPQTNFFGQAVMLEHGTWLGLPVYTLYGHVSELLVAEGESVQAGQPIALTGQGGVALGPHLHLEVRLGNSDYYSTQNPDLWVRPDPAFGVIAGRIVDDEGYYVPQQLVTLHKTSTPNQFWRQTHTYPDSPTFTQDPQLGETFTFADVFEGTYIVQTRFDGKTYSMPVTVRNQEVTFVLIDGSQTPPSATATPEPEAEATPEATDVIEETPDGGEGEGE